MCDHIIGYELYTEGYSFVNASDKYRPDYAFDYCPLCGEKLGEV